MDPLHPFKGVWTRFAVLQRLPRFLPSFFSRTPLPAARSKTLLTAQAHPEFVLRRTVTYADRQSYSTCPSTSRKAAKTK
jgi:hypothetical protein